MRKIGVRFLLGAFCVVALAVAIVRVRADEEDIVMRARLTGFEEVGAPVLAPNPTPATGTFRASLREDGTTLDYKLTWTNNLTSPVLFAHIHFAMRGVNGGVMAFLCGGGGKPACSGGMATGTITAADIRAIASQGFTANNFTDFLRSIRSGDGYANLHTVNFPGGEIRGQIQVHGDHDRD